MPPAPPSAKRRYSFRRNPRQRGADRLSGQDRMRREWIIGLAAGAVIGVAAVTAWGWPGPGAEAGGLAGDLYAGRGTADRRGQWVLAQTQLLPQGDHQLPLSGRGKDG